MFKKQITRRPQIISEKTAMESVAKILRVYPRRSKCFALGSCHPRAKSTTAVNLKKKTKVFPSSAAAVSDIPNGASMFIGGFGTCGLPENLLNAVKEAGPKDLDCVTNNPGKESAVVSPIGKPY